MNRARVFIGSSSESLTVARTLKKSLAKNCEVSLWTKGVFRLTLTSFESLLDAARFHDFSVFVLGPDDVLEIKGTLKRASRDNVLFELGLFLGALGRDGCFFVAPSDVRDFRIPSDLSGVVYATYRSTGSRENRARSVRVAARQIKAAIDGAGSPGASLQGLWRQTWKTEVDGKPTQFTSQCSIRHVGRRLHGRFRSVGRRYEVLGEADSRHVTGIWRDERAGGTYFGAFQLVISPLQKAMSGKWVGWSRGGFIRAGDWEWQRG